MTARLIDLQPGDEVIVPSYTFVSTASAFSWNGARPVFADVSPDTMNIDPASVRRLINPRTKAVCIIHYGGVAADPDTFCQLAEDNNLFLIEDNAHGLGARHGDRMLGTFGHLSTLSFHETKNVTCGEGGALVINDPVFLERAEILREKGTNRARFLRGQVDKYTWIDNGSSWVMSDMLAAVLLGQLERFDEIQCRRMAIWNRYHEELAEWASINGVATPTIPDDSFHPGHMYHLRLPSFFIRENFIGHLRNHGIMAVFHYQSLHTSPQGLRFGGAAYHCPVSDSLSETVVRLPLFYDLSVKEQATIIQAVQDFDVKETVDS